MKDIILNLRKVSDFHYCMVVYTHLLLSIGSSGKQISTLLTTKTYGHTCKLLITLQDLPNIVGNYSILINLLTIYIDKGTILGNKSLDADRKESLVEVVQMASRHADSPQGQEYGHPDMDRHSFEQGVTLAYYNQQNVSR